MGEQPDSEPVPGEKGVQPPSTAAAAVSGLPYPPSPSTKASLRANTSSLQRLLRDMCPLLFAPKANFAQKHLRERSDRGAQPARHPRPPRAPAGMDVASEGTGDRWEHPGLRAKQEGEAGEGSSLARSPFGTEGSQPGQARVTLPCPQMCRDSSGAHRCRDPGVSGECRGVRGSSRGVGGSSRGCPRALPAGTGHTRAAAPESLSGYRAGHRHPRRNGTQGQTPRTPGVPAGLPPAHGGAAAGGQAAAAASPGLRSGVGAARAPTGQGSAARRARGCPVRPGPARLGSERGRISGWVGAEPPPSGVPSSFPRSRPALQPRQ